MDAEEWSGWSQCAVAVVGVAWLFTIPRTFGPANYGLLVLMTSLVDFHTMCSCLGINNALAYYLPKLKAEGRREDLAALTTGYGSLVMSIATVGAVVVAAAGHGLGGAAVTRWIIGCVVTNALLQAANGALGGILYGENRISAFALRVPLQQLLWLIMILGGYKSLGLPGAFMGMAGASAVTFVGLICVARPWRYLVNFRGWTMSLRGPVRFGLMATFGALGTLTITRGGNLILFAVGVPAAGVASYAVGVGFVLQGALVLAALATAITPALSHLLAEGDSDRAYNWAKRAASYQIIAGVIVTAAVVFLGRQVLSAAVGSKYEHVFGITLIAMIGLLPLAQLSLTNAMAVAWGRPRVNLEGWVLLSVTFVLAVGLLGHWHGAVGAACGLAAAAWTASVYAGVRLHALNGPRMWPATAIKLVALAAPGFALMALQRGLLVNLGLFVIFCAYFLPGAFLIKAVSMKEVREVLCSMRRS